MRSENLGKLGRKLDRKKDDTINNDGSFTPFDFGDFDDFCDFGDF